MDNIKISLTPKQAEVLHGLLEDALLHYSDDYEEHQIETFRAVRDDLAGELGFDQE